MLAAQSNTKLSEPLALNPPPCTPVEPVVEKLHGVEVVDPYRWLEDQNSARTRQWLAEQTAYTRAYFSTIPDRDRISKRVAELLDVETVSEPRKVGDRYFYLKRAAGQEQPVIMMREGDGGSEIPLIDPAEMGQGSAIAVNILCVSNDGKLLAYSLRRGGEDSCEICFLSVEQRQVLSDGLTDGFCRGLAFSPDNTGFYYVHRPVGAPPHLCCAVRHHLFGTDSSTDTAIFSPGENPHLHLGMFASPDGRFLAYLVASAQDKRTVDFYVHEVASRQLPRQIAAQLDGVFAPAFAGERVIALTDWQAPNGRIVWIDAAHPQRDRWQEIVPEVESRICDFAVVGNLIFLGYVEKLSSTIKVFDLTGRQRGILTCLPLGTARLFPVSAHTDEVFARCTSFSHPPEIHRYNTRTGGQTIWAESHVPLEPKSIEVEQVRYRSKDGTLVPMFLVSQAGRPKRLPQPTFLTAYGGFGASITPQFTAYATFLIEHGCLFAVANVRGGSELGRQWHEAGKRHNRQNAINDFLGAAEWLVAHHRADPNRIALGGGSNAALLVAAALTQRPDLFRAVVCLGPLLDMLRYQHFDFAEQWKEEYGSAETEADFRHLLAYSPYHRVAAGEAYPAVLLISGDADTRCNSMHARKMTAKLQAATSSQHPILLDYKPTWGHMPVQPLTKRIEALTDRLSFITHELGPEV